MDRQMRSRKRQNMDRKNNHAEMAAGVPRASAKKQMVHKAYSPYTVNDYLEKLVIDTGRVIEGGQKNTEAVQVVTE